MLTFSHMSEPGIFTFTPKYVQRPKRYQIELGGSPVVAPKCPREALNQSTGAPLCGWDTSGQSAEWLNSTPLSVERCISCVSGAVAI